MVKLRKFPKKTNSSSSRNVTTWSHDDRLCRRLPPHPVPNGCRTGECLTSSTAHRGLPGRTNPDGRSITTNGKVVNQDSSGRQRVHLRRQPVLAFQIENNDDIPEDLKSKGYKDFSTAFVRTHKKRKYGYFEIVCLLADSNISSAFWFAGRSGDHRTELDVFEYSTSDKPVRNSHYRNIFSTTCTSMHIRMRASPTNTRTSSRTTSDSIWVRRGLRSGSIAAWLYRVVFEWCAHQKDRK